jgi:hypothetical protein
MSVWLLPHGLMPELHGVDYISFRLFRKDTTMSVKLSLTALVLLLSAFVPTVSTAAPGMSSSFVIATMGTRETVMELQVTPGITSPMGCANTTYVRLPTSAANYNAISANLLTAFSTGKAVVVYVSGCDSEGVSLIVSAYVSR